MKVKSFTTPTCNYCKITEPMLEGKASAGKFELEQIDAIENKEDAEQYDIQGAPTIVILEDGKEPKKATGVLEINKAMESI